MNSDAMTIIDLLDDLDLDIQGFEDLAPKGDSLLFPFGLYSLSEASTSALNVAWTDPEPTTFELLDEVALDPPVWVAAGAPIWDNIPQPIQDYTEDPHTPRCQTFRSLTIEVPPRSPSRTLSRPSPKENLSSPTERAFARLRDRGSSLALKAINSALSSPEIRHRVLI